MIVDSHASSGSGSSGLDFLGRVAGIATLLYVWVFLVGWMSTAEFFGQFNVDVSSLDLPSYDFAVHSLFTFAFLPKLELVLALILLAILIVFAAKLVAWKFLRQKLRIIGPGLVPVCFLFSLAISIWYGDYKANIKIRDSPRIRLAFKTGDRQPYEDELLNANKEGTLFLLTQTKDLVLVFLRPKDLSPPHASIFVLSRSDLSSLHLLTR